MINRTTIMFLALLGMYTVQASEVSGGVEKTTTKKSEKSTIVQQLKAVENGGGSEFLCSVAAGFGRTLKLLPQSKGAISKEKLAKKCGNYFLGKNDSRTQHPQAYAAVMNYEGKDAVAIDQYAEEAAKSKGIKHEPNPIRLTMAKPSYTRQTTRTY